MTGFGMVDRRGLRSVAVQFFVNGALSASFIPRLPEIRDRVGISVATVGLLLSVAGASGLVGSLGVGPAISRFGTRRVMLAAGAVVSVSLAVVGLATSPGVLAVALAAMLGFDVLVDASMNMQGSWLSGRRHSPVMNRLHGLWSLGTLVGGFVSSRVAAAGVSLQVHLTVSAVALLAVLVYVGPGLLRVDEAVPVADGAAAARGGRAGLESVLLLIGCAGFFAVAMESTAIEWAAFRIGDDFGTTAGRAALGYVAVAGGMTLGRFAGDATLVRLGPVRLSRLALVLSGIGLAAASLVGDAIASLAGFFVAGLGIATLLPGLYDLAARSAGKLGAGLGALTAGLRLASLTIPLLVGVTAGAGHPVGVAVAAVTLPSAVGFGLTVMALRRRRVHLPPF